MERFNRGLGNQMAPVADAPARRGMRDFASDYPPGRRLGQFRDGFRNKFDELNARITAQGFGAFRKRDEAAPGSIQGQGAAPSNPPMASDVSVPARPIMPRPDWREQGREQGRGQWLEQAREFGSRMPVMASPIATVETGLGIEPIDGVASTTGPRRLGDQFDVGKIYERVANGQRLRSRYVGNGKFEPTV